MYYAFLFIAVGITGIQFSLMKIYQKKAGQSLLATLLFSLLNELINATILFFYNKCSLRIGIFTLGCSIACALLLFVYNLLCIKALGLGDMSVFSMFMMLGGMLLPFFFGALYLHEHISPFQIVGIVLLAAALILPCVKVRSGKIRVAFIIVCACIFCVNGGVSIVSKLHQTSANASGPADFTICNNLLAACLSLPAFLLCLWRQKKKYRALVSSECEVPDIAAQDPKSQCTGALRLTPLIAVYSVIVSIGFLLLLYAASHLPASVQYPIVSGGTVILSTLIGRFFFHEKTSLLTYIGVFLALIATVLFMF